MVYLDQQDQQNSKCFQFDCCDSDLMQWADNIKPLGPVCWRIGSLLLHNSEISTPNKFQMFACPVQSAYTTKMHLRVGDYIQQPSVIHISFAGSYSSVMV